MTAIHTNTDFMVELAKALNNGDGDHVNRLRQQTEDWLEGRDVQDARTALLDAVENAVYELQDAGVC